jgi:NADH:flavin oxidoreductase / NADH oxidase family
MTTEGKQKVDVLTPIKAGPLMLPKRIVMAPLTRNRGGPGDVPREMSVFCYAQRASAGLIISEASPFDPLGHGFQPRRASIRLHGLPFHGYLPASVTDASLDLHCLYLQERACPQSSH